MVRGFLAWILVIRIEDLIFCSIGVVKEIPGSVNIKEIGGLFFFSVFFLHVFVIKVQESAWSAS